MAIMLYAVPVVGVTNPGEQIEAAGGTLTPCPFPIVELHIAGDSMDIQQVRTLLYSWGKAYFYLLDDGVRTVVEVMV